MNLNWSTISFESLFLVPQRNGLTRPKRVRGRGVHFVNMGELFAHRRLGNVPMDRVLMNNSERRKFLLSPGDLLFARQSLTLAGAGQCSIVLPANEPRTFESHLIRVRFNRDKAVPGFYFYLFWSRPGRDLIESIVEQVAAAGIRGSDLRRLPVPVPPLDEQRRIAAILGALDDKIELNRKMNRTLEEMAQAIFKSWFIDFDGVPDSEMVESELGPIPRGWVTIPASEIMTLIGGGTPKKSVEEYWGGDIPWFSVRDAPSSSDIFVLETEAHITAAGLAGSSAKLIEPWTTIISARGTVGKLAVAAYPMTFNQSCYGVRASAGHGDVFIHFVLRDLVDHLQRAAHGSVFDTITRETFRTVMVRVPPAQTALDFGDMVFPLLSRIHLNGRESRTLAALRDALLPKLISGEVRVPEAEAIVDARY